ncbi:MAG: methionyl-tRNA synthetase [Parcubacteria group bacterium Gr01-1014_72]|nr:MAG: methionyl-tRNA synthetase [Parcubacteria group bacterium Gr01-1014_72]
MPKPLYITTTLPYVNADPHIGFAAEIVAADIYARHARLLGREVFFNTGTDEHGQKIYEAAKKEGKEVQEYVDEYAEKFKDLKSALGLSDDINFIRTTDSHHIAAAEEFWRRCDKAGYIYKKNYKVKYCVGCELEKTDSELADGKCSVHPNLSIEEIDEENYFFKFSAFQEKLLALYKERPDFVIPDFRFNEIKAFVARGLQDFSISRLAAKMPWGVPVPSDPAHVMYVWFEAFINYISAIGWPTDETKFQKWWVESEGVVQFAGKDQVRQQAAMWQAMLMAVGLPPSRQIVIHGFITSGGQKMSKSFGNVINPHDLVREYGTDAVRYFLLREVNPFEDSPVTLERIKESYNSGLANGLGNLAARILQMSSQYLSEPLNLSDQEIMTNLSGTGKVIFQRLDTYECNRAMDALWSWIQDLDVLIQEQKPFEVVKINKTAAQKQLTYMIKNLAEIALLLEPFMPETSKKIKVAIKENKKPETLFPRK